jgi:septal ring factor EnvC (AmiA/AmiB activator)
MVTTMTSDDPFQAMMAERYAIVAKLTELNSAHLSREGRRAGVEFEMARCRQTLAAAPTPELESRLAELEREHREVIAQTCRIEAEREALILQLEDIVNRLNAPHGDTQS